MLSFLLYDGHVIMLFVGLARFNKLLRGVSWRLSARFDSENVPHIWHARCSRYDGAGLCITGNLIFVNVCQKLTVTVTKPQIRCLQ